MCRIETTVNLSQAVKDADFVVEVVSEDLELKKEMFKKLDELCPAHAILASNSSTLSIQEMANATKRPDKVILTHYLNPPSYYAPGRCGYSGGDLW